MLGIRISKTLFIAMIALLLHSVLLAQQVTRKCGFIEMKNYLFDKYPGAAEAYEQQQQTLQLQAQAYKQQRAANIAYKTNNANDTIPIIYHIVLEQSQIDQLGGVAGIAQRIDSQMVVINRDYNRMNGDSSQIPADFKQYYTNVGIRFGLARKTPSGTATPGYEIITTNLSGFSLYNGTVGSMVGFSDAKYASSGGANIWDPTTYLNVWIINPVNSNGVLGLTFPHSFATGLPGGYPVAELGVVINYGVLGVQADPSQYFILPFTEGRTLTHELGHFFEMVHTWGDDGGLCPWDVNGADDGIADTPPQSDATHGRRTFPTYDSCSPTGDGIMYMNYMDYTDDSDMHMFTNDQQTVMQATIQPGAESYSLTQHPDVLIPLAVSSVEVNNTFNIVPNPAGSFVRVLFNEAPQSLRSVSVTNLLGQTLQTVIINSHTTSYTIDLSAISTGIYLIQCHFTEGIITRKIVKQ